MNEGTVGLSPFVTEGNNTDLEGLFFYRLREKLWKLHQEKMGNLYARNEFHSERGRVGSHWVSGYSRQLCHGV